MVVPRAIFHINETVGCHIVAGAVLLFGCGATIVGVRRIGPQHDVEERVLEFLDLESSTLDKLQQKVRIEPGALEKTVRRLLRQGTIHEDAGQFELADTVASRAESSRATHARQ
jgi:hypothetical protein